MHLKKFDLYKRFKLILIMGKTKYRCSICSKKFSRRWNAQRHNDAIHKDAALIKHLPNVKPNYNCQFKIPPYGFNISKFKIANRKFDSEPINYFTSSCSSLSYPFKSFNNYYQNNSKNSSVSMNEDEQKENLLYLIDQ